MSRTSSRLIVPFFIALSLSMQAIPALAAPAEWSSVDVILQPAQQESMLLVSGELPPEVKLPAEAELAVPAGTKLQWIGEILGGDTSKDPTLKYEQSSSQGMDVYRFTLTQARVAQVEVVVPGMTSSDGTNYVTGLKWTAWTDLPEVTISQRLAQSAQIVQAAEGATLQPGGTGYAYYTKTVASPKSGDVIDLSFSYTLPAGGANAGGAGAGAPASNNVAIAIILMVVAGATFLFVRGVSRKTAAKAAAAAEREVKKRPTSAGSRTSASQKLAKPAVEPIAETPRKRVKPAVPVMIILGIFVVGFMIAGNKGTSATVVNGLISRNFGAASACQSTSMPFTANPGVDLAVAGDELMKGFEGMDGVGQITVNLAESKIDMAWCESSQSEESMRQVLSMTGMITLGQGTSSAESVPTTATIDTSGKTQTAAVDTSSGSFTPGQLVLKAGIPSEIVFGEATGCLSEVVMKQLGINQDLTKGPATVKLPALEAGTYAFACAMGHQSGQLVVQ